MATAFAQHKRGPDRASCLGPPTPPINPRQHRAAAAAPLIDYRSHGAGLPRATVGGREWGRRTPVRSQKKNGGGGLPLAPLSVNQSGSARRELPVHCKWTSVGMVMVAGGYRLTGEHHRILYAWAEPRSRKIFFFFFKSHRKPIFEKRIQFYTETSIQVEKL